MLDDYLLVDLGCLIRQYISTILSSLTIFIQSNIEMADSWEDEAVNQPPKLNPTAASFNFNPGASTFTLTGASNTPEEPPKPVVAPPSKPESTPSPMPAAPESKTNGTQESPKDAAPESREDGTFTILDHPPGVFSSAHCPSDRLTRSLTASSLPFISFPFLQPLRPQPSKQRN
jgi:hypothetical protein